jgi:hypothetical protein
MNCHSCVNIPNEVIDNKYCKAYTPQQIYNCKEKEIETFVVSKPQNVAYEVKLDTDANNVVDQVYQYNYTNNKYIDHTTDVQPILYVAGEPVVFTDAKTNQNYYFDQSTNSLIKYGEPDEPSKVTMLNSQVDYKNPLDVKNKILQNHFTQAPKPTQSTESAVDKCKKLIVAEQPLEEESYSEEDPVQTTAKPITKNNAKLIDNLTSGGLSKSFILSFIHEMGSKEMKVKYIEDDNDKLTDGEIDTLKKLNAADNNNDNYNNNDNIIEEEEYKNTLEVVHNGNIDITIDKSNADSHSHYHTHNDNGNGNGNGNGNINAAVTTKSTPMEIEETTTQKPCPKIKQTECKYGQTIKYKGECPYIECNKQPTYEYNISLTTRIILYIVTIIIIALFVMFMRYNYAN